VTLFSVQLELGPETRAMIERVATSSTMQVEFGPNTLETLRTLFPKDADEGDAGEGLLRKGAQALRK
jgi:hypothetical protein